MLNENYKVPEVYGGTYQDTVGNIGVSTFVNGLIATNLYKEEDIYIPPKFGGYIHSDDAIHGKDILIRGVPIDLKWYISLSKKGVIWIEYNKFRKDNNESDWRFIHFGVFDNKYQPYYIVWGDRNWNQFYFIPVQQLRDYINSIPEEERVIHEHTSSDAKGLTYVRDYEISLGDLKKNHLIPFTLDVNSK